jgi:type III pantothenate kinase
MLLAVDVGNTKIKAAVFEGNALLEKFILDKNEPVKEVKKIFKKFPKIDFSILSTVGNHDPELLNALREATQLIEISHDSAFPFINKYSTPKTLGIDRMVLAAGGVLQFPGQNRLVIDAGTCITYDFIDSSDAYLGGAISPGLRLRYESLHNFTAKLPLLSAEVPESHIGDSTSQSIHSGVVKGVINEIEGFIQLYEKDYSRLIIILTGGDADFLAKQFKSAIFANSNFLLESLNQLYTYTIKK